MPSPHTAASAARNESIFRELNEHLGAAVEGAPSEERGFVCECADMSCTEVLAVQIPAYEAVRRDPQRFIVAPDDAHVDLTVEKVVERTDGYWVVEKVGVAGDVAADLDPRE